LPPYVIHAVLSAEDHDYYRHQGFVLKGVLRAVLANLKAGGIRQGGSTITQQLAKNYFLTSERTYRRKIKELLIAVLLEFKFSKTDILEIYLNEIYWGQQGSVAINGMTEASRFYFDKEAAELSVAEAATLAGLIRAPNIYSPYKNPEKCLNRRDVVLSAMLQEGWLGEDELKTALATPLTPAGYTPKSRLAPYFLDYLTDQLTELYSPEALTSEGLSIYTTIDTQVQSAAEDALESGLNRLEENIPSLKRDDPEKQLQGIVIVMEPKTGYIIAMVGGRDYGVSQYNRAANALRQPGSAFKPFVYLSALDTHTTISELSNAPQTFMIDGKPWEPKNFEEDAPEELTLREALAKSQNIATVNLAFSVGLDHVAETAKAFHLPVSTVYPSMVLGALEVSPLMLARAYCTFAADGVLPFPLSINVVVDDTGSVVESHHASIERLITPAKAYMISDLMRSAVETGTGRSLRYRGVDWPVAGKTGTTDNSRDAWFVGYTPDILALVWVGFDNGDSVQATGAGAALPIWAELMKALPQYVSGDWFTMPSGVETHAVCTETGLLATECCPDTTDELFLSETVPTETCGEHVCPSAFHDFLEGVIKIVPGF
jgi:penicillin-binding protein 1B